ncbi:MAG: hypothetical protein GY906_21385 [bacterium]|nr:hypothetical protein [bacterium]
MGNSSRWFVAVIVILIGIAAASAVLLRSQVRCAGFEGGGVMAAELPAGPASDGRFRVVSWNVRNFPLDERPQDADLGYSRRTNICDLEDTLRGLQGDILGLSEIADTRRFPPILRRSGGERRYGIAFSQRGGRFGQHVAVAWDREQFQSVGSPVEIVDVMVGNPDLRPALAVRLESLTNDLNLTVVSVHFKSAPRGYKTRLRQYDALAEWVRNWVEQQGDDDVIVLGDFNTTGSENGDLADELAEMDSILGRAGLRRLVNPLGCSEYWEGRGARDGIQVPSLLDHIFVRGLDGGAAEVDAWLHCKRFECTELISQPGDEDATFWDVSDHCPITVDLKE